MTVTTQLVHNRIDLKEIQSDFVPRCSLIVNLVKHLQEKYLTKNKLLFLAFFDLEKVLDRIPHSVIR